MAKPTGRTFFTNYERNRPLIAAFHVDEETRTQQHFKAECDINVIMSKYLDTGLIPGGNAGTAIYGDFSEVSDYQASLDIIATAKDQFAQLPAKARARFNNDPAELLIFVNNPKNTAEAHQLGLLQDEPPPLPATPPSPKAPEAK